jgi:hypothetical protein
MKTKRVVSNELLTPGANEEEEAKKHPDLINGFTHWASMGWDVKEKCPVMILTFDPDCPRCKEVNSHERT